MRNVDFPPSVVARAVARRGTEHIFADLNPKRTALVVIDLFWIKNTCDARCEVL